MSRGKSRSSIRRSSPSTHATLEGFVVRELDNVITQLERLIERVDDRTDAVEHKEEDTAQELGALRASLDSVELSLFEARQLLQEHIEKTVVHGLETPVVGVSDRQTVRNKQLEKSTVAATLLSYSETLEPGPALRLPPAQVMFIRDWTVERTVIIEGKVISI